MTGSVEGRPDPIAGARTAADWDNFSALAPIVQHAYLAAMVKEYDKQAAALAAAQADNERLRKQVEQKRGGQIGYFAAAAQAIEERDEARAELATAQARADELENAAKIVLEAPMGTSGRYLVAAEAFDFLRAALAGDAARPNPEADDA